MLSSTLLVSGLLTGALATSSYAPTSVACPSSLVRLASGLSTSEAAWRAARKPLADTALRSWLKATNPAFDTTGTLPALGLAISGGGYRAHLTGAGVIQALDANDSDVSTSGLYQAITYHSALSGGAWLLSSLADHDYPTVSSLLSSQWSSAFSNGLLAPNGLWTLVSYAEILTDINAKENAGFRSSLTDLWARLLGYQMLSGASGGVASTLSGLQSKSNFASHNVPYPIITALNSDLKTGTCAPTQYNASVWELTPFEMGSWAPDVNAFTPSKYLGTTMSNGVANGTCVNGFDNLGFVLGTSSNVFNDIAAFYSSLTTTLDTICASSIGIEESNELGAAIAALETIFPSLTSDLSEAVEALYALYPNPFYNLASATSVSSMETLHMVDGGESGQTSPIFPHLIPERNVSLIIVNDNNGDYPTTTLPSYPNGTAIYASYMSAKHAGLKRMPVVPSPTAYFSNYTSGNPIFFGCKNSSVATIVWIPNTNVTYDSGISTFSLQYDSTLSEDMVANGNAVMSRGNSAAWATCLGCAILDAGGLKVPSSCEACFKQYCYAG
jgi:lysophospholipase